MPKKIAPTRVCGIEALIDFLDDGETAQNEQRKPQLIDVVQQKLHDYNSTTKQHSLSFFCHKLFILCISSFHLFLIL